MTSRSFTLVISAPTLKRTNRRQSRTWTRSRRRADLALADQNVNGVRVASSNDGRRSVIRCAVSELAQPVGAIARTTQPFSATSSGVRASRRSESNFASAFRE